MMISNSKKAFFLAFLALVSLAFVSCKSSKGVDQKDGVVVKDVTMNKAPVNDPTTIDAQTSATVQTTNLPNDQTTSLPNAQTTNLPNDQTTSLPNDQTTSLPNDQTTSLPNAQTTDLPNDQTTSLPNDQPPHEGFVYVKTLIPDLIEDLRYATTNNFMGEKADGYEGTRVILSRPAAEALKSAADELREKGYVIKVFDAYRPQRAVNHFVRWSKSNDQRNKADYFPTLRKNQLFPKYIAYKSGHTKGSTIDMTICDKNTKEEVDMGGHFDYFGEPSHPSFIGKYSLGEVTQEHKKRRLMLREVMIRHGFKPYDSEWWHFTLKNEPYPNTWFDFPVK